MADDLWVPSLSVVIPTVSSWDTVEPIVSGVLTSLEPVDGELLLASGAYEPPLLPRNVARVRILHLPGADVFALRAAGIAAARGEVVAVTEDHCRLPDDWCVRVRDLFAADPELEVLGGAVVSGSELSLMDRANFRMTFARFAPTALVARAPCISNVAIRRRVRPLQLAPGWFEHVLLPASTPSARTRMRSDLVVTHVQSHSAWRTPIVHFHNGRVTGAFAARYGGVEGFRPALRYAFLETRSHLRVTRKSLRAAGIGRNALWPVRLLALAHAVGFIIGANRGPGDSARHLV